MSAMFQIWSHSKQGGVSDVMSYIAPGREKGISKKTTTSVKT